MFGKQRNHGSKGVAALGAAAAVTAVVAALAGPAAAAFPGANGKLAIASDRDGDYEIYSMSSDGTSLTQLTTNGTADESPAWSPDGRRIAFVHALAKRQGIVVMTADGAGAKRVAGGAIAYAYPDWQPVR